jgi:hypothetical protein
MATSVMVMIEDPDNSGHGEMKVLAGPEDAARHIESLIESGFDPERIRAFYADKIEMQVSHRPVVALVGEDQGTKTSDEAVPADDHIESPVEEPVLVASVPIAVSEARQEVQAQPFTRDGVRFSSQFKPA